MREPPVSAGPFRVTPQEVVRLFTIRLDGRTLDSKRTVQKTLTDQQVDRGVSVSELQFGVRLMRLFTSGSEMTGRRHSRALPSLEAAERRNARTPAPRISQPFTSIKHNRYSKVQREIKNCVVRLDSGCEQRSDDCNRCTDYPVSRIFGGGMMRFCPAPPRCIRGVVLFFSLLLTAMPHGASAAATAENADENPSNADAGSEEGLAEVLVTAEKRQGRIQDVPVSVVAFDAGALAKAGVTNIQEIGQLAAGVTLTEAAGTLTPMIRGIGNSIATAGNESSTAVYLDDVYVSRLAGGFLQLADIDRVEVLKGPQGTLFGRNASGGLINIFTRDPMRDPGGNLSISYGNYDSVTAKAYFGGALSDRLSADLSTFYVNQGEGWGRNLYNGNEQGYLDAFVVRSKVIFEPSPGTRVRLIADYNWSESTANGLASGVARGFISQTPAFYSRPPFNEPATVYTAADGFYNVDFNARMDNHTHGEGVSLRIDHDFSYFRASSITAYRTSGELYTSEGDFTPAPWQAYFLPARFHTTSQELQLVSTSRGNFNWVTGLFYLRAFSEYPGSRIFGDSVSLAINRPPGSAINIIGEQTIDDYAAYAQGDYRIAEHTAVTLGARYTLDDLQADGRTQDIRAGAETTSRGIFDSSTSFRKFTYRISLDQHFAEGIMGYVSASSGFKSGTYNLFAGAPQPAALPEVVKAYEVGLKTTLFDRRVDFNVAAFENDVIHPQLQTTSNGLSQVSNAQKARARGVDIDGRFLAMEGLVLRMGAEYLDAKYTRFTNAPIIAPRFSPPYGSSPQVQGDASGNDMVLAPKFTANAGLGYHTETAIGSFSTDLNYSYNSGFSWTADEYLKEGSYSLVNASVAFSPAHLQALEISLWAQNLTDTEYSVRAQQLSNEAGYRQSPGAPRTYGIQLGYHF
jgi:iron complex outermembrane recepter protein